MSKYLTRDYQDCKTPAHFMRYWRERAHLSRDSLAEKADISKTVLERWELGAHGPTVELAWRVADALGISIDEYVGRTKRETQWYEQN